GLAGFDPLAQADHEIERDRRVEDFGFDLVLARLDPFGDLDFLLPRQELEVAHLLEIEANRVRRLTKRIRRRLGNFLGFFLGLRLGLTVSGLGGGNLVENLDVEVLEAVERRAEIRRRGDILRQEIIDLVESQVTLLTAKVDQTAEVFTFVLLLHAAETSVPYGVSPKKWPPASAIGLG